MFIKKEKGCRFFFRIATFLFLFTALLVGGAEYTRATGDDSFTVSHTVTQDGMVVLEIASPYPNKPVTLVVTSGSNRDYINQFDTDGDGNASFSFPLPQGKEYLASIKISGQKKELTISTIAEPGDTTPPVFAEGYPRAESIGTTSFELKVKLDEPGTAYYKVVADGTEPGSDYESWTAVPVPGTDEVSATVGELTAATAYDVYVIAKDTANNFQAATEKLDVTTAAEPGDTTPPVFAEGYPKAENVTTTGFELKVKLDEAGTAYYKVVADGTEAGSDYESWTAVPVPGTDEVIAAVGGLTAATDYDVYVIAKDTSDNLQATPEKVDVTTAAEPDETPPVISVSGLSDGMIVNTAELSFTVTAIDERDGEMTPVVKLGEIELSPGEGGSYTCTLAEGVNTITIEAVDSADNQAREIYTVTYQESIRFVCSVNAEGEVTLEIDSDYPNTQVTLQVTSGSSFYYFNQFPTDGDGNASIFFSLPLGKEYLVAIKISGQKKELTISTIADTTPPAFAEGYPKAENIGTTGFELKVKLDEPGTAYYKVVADGTEAGSDYESWTAVAIDDTDEVSAAVGGLTAGTAYDVYVIAKDTANNLQNATVQLDVTTAEEPGDTTPPVFAEGYPKAENIGTTGFELKVKLNEAGTAYYKVVADGTEPGGEYETWTAVAVGDTDEVSAAVGGLTAGTDYDVYVIARDTAGNWQAVTVRLDVTTAEEPGDTTPPVFAEGYPKAENIGATGFDLKVKLDEPGTAYYKVVAEGTEPGGDYESWTAVDIDDTDEVSVTVGGLTAGTDYDVYVIARDAVGNWQALAEKLDVTTAAYPTPVIADYKIKINGIEVQTDLPIVEMNGIVMGPVRCVVDALGIQSHWDEAKQQITFTSPNKTLVLTVNSPSGALNESPVSLPVPPIIYDNITMVPLQFVVETFGGTIAKAVAAPTVFPAGGAAVVAGARLTLTTVTGGAAIHYTLDGITPTAGSPTYTGPITINGAVTLKAIAVKDGMEDSAVLIASYTMAVPIDNRDIEVSEDNKNLAVTEDTVQLGAPVNVTVPDSVTDARISVAALMKENPDGTITTEGLPALNIAVHTDEISETDPVVVAIPAGTIVNAPAGWNGTINVPTVRPNDSVTVTPDSGNTATVNTVIEIGFGDMPLTFNRAVRILIPGQAGKDVGYSRGSEFTKIARILSKDDQDVADEELPSEGDGKIDADNGNDLVVWTKHFTKFVTYTQTPVGSDTTKPSWRNGKLTASNVGRTELTLNWSGADDNVGVTEYKLYQGETLVSTVPASESSHKVTDLSAGTEYTFTVQAVDAAGNQSTDGPSVTVTTASPSPGGGGGGGGGPSAVTSTTGTAMVPPGAGGTISLGDEAAIKIPANALQGSRTVEVKIQKVDQSPQAPAGFRLAGDAYRFSVGGADSYSFNKPVTLTFSFDPDALAPGEKAEVYYYDASGETWVRLGGTVSGNTITVTVDHFTIFAVLAGAAEPEEPKEPEEPAPGPAVSPTDIAGHWAENTISRLVAQGILSGYPDGTFRPDGTITRAEFVIILTQAYNIAAPGDKVFEDTGSHWARDSIAAAVSAGIVSGYEDNTFRPDQPVTREQMAVLAAKAAGLQETADISAFTDYQQISPWAGEAVAAMVQAGVMRGYPDGSFLPQSGATRAEAAIVIAGLLER